MQAPRIAVSEIKLIGLDLGRPTSNKNGRSGRDGGKLWQQFEKLTESVQIPNSTGNQRYAVYYGYEGNHEQPFRYFIGCPVSSFEEVPEGMDTLVIPAGEYQKVTASGPMPGCMVQTWQMIWNADEQLNRSYRCDFELYDERSHNWEEAEVDIFLS